MSKNIQKISKKISKNPNWNFFALSVFLAPLKAELDKKKYFLKIRLENIEIFNGKLRTINCKKKVMVEILPKAILVSVL